MARGKKAVSKDARDVVYKVYLYFMNESETFKSNDGYFQRVRRRVADATGLSIKFIYRLLKEEGRTKPEPFSLLLRKSLEEQKDGQSNEAPSTATTNFYKQQSIIPGHEYIQVQKIQPDTSIPINSTHTAVTEKPPVAQTSDKPKQVSNQESMIPGHKYIILQNIQPHTSISTVSTQPAVIKTPPTALTRVNIGHSSSATSVKPTTITTTPKLFYQTSQNVQSIPLVESNKTDPKINLGGVKSGILAVKPNGQKLLLVPQIVQQKPLALQIKAPQTMQQKVIPATRVLSKNNVKKPDPVIIKVHRKRPNTSLPVTEPSHSIEPKRISIETCTVPKPMPETLSLEEIKTENAEDEADEKLVINPLSIEKDPEDIVVKEEITIECNAPY